jgi:hypothetical protein
MGGNGIWVRTNVYAAGQLIANYKNDATRVIPLRVSSEAALLSALKQSQVF